MLDSGGCGLCVRQRLSYHGFYWSVIGLWAFTLLALLGAGSVPAATSAAFTVSTTSFATTTSTKAGITAERPTPVNITCSADLLCVKVFKTAQHTRLMLETYSHKPLSFALYLEGDSLRHIKLVPITIDHPQTLELINFATSHQRWGYAFRIHFGHQGFQHKDDYIYTLPFAQKAAFRVTQSQDNLSTHHSANANAIDWAMSEGDAVHAARAGVVVSRFGKARGNSLQGRAVANHIWLQHSDGTIGKYLHLAAHSLLVAEGDLVATGQRIASAGNTGLSHGPHLHFSVSTLSQTANLYQTFAIRFATEAGPQHLVSGRFYQRMK